LAWVWERAKSFSGLDTLVVATDDPAILELCDSLGAPAVLTSREHPSGTDRVAEVAGLPDYRDYAYIVNLQGDEPLMDPAHVEAAIRLIRDDGWELGTCATALQELHLLSDPSVVKVARSQQGRALYFSRAAIPHLREGAPREGEMSHWPYLRHLGLYSYQRDALLKWVAAPPSPLETMERLEQLRALELGLSMGVAVVGPAARGVDTPEDLAHLESLLLEDHLKRATDLHPSAPQGMA
jgi:3-deoxy-manno-octulosonate cytidylyltransferase (CMP-KDO synthetase)